jgi:hypothetical protein
VSKTILIAFTACLSLTILGGCGDKKEATPSGGGSGKPAAPVAEGPEVKLDPATAGTIKGRIKFANAPDPMPKQIDMGEKTKECGTMEKPKMEEFYVVGENNAAANVLVFVKSGPAKNIKTPPPTNEVVLDQVNCAYTPHVLGMRAGQPLRVKSSDPTSHNVHLQGNLNGDWNKTMNANSSFIAGEGDSKKVEFPEIIKVKCDIHSFMSATIGAFAHDAFAVTKSDGLYELKNLPPGKYEIEVKHERAKAKPQMVELGAKETKELNFELKFE